MAAISAPELAAIPLFRTLAQADLEELAGWFETRDVSAGVRLTGEGAAGYSFFILVDGAASVTSNGEQVATLGPGDFFGEIAILDGGRRTATVTTTAPARVLAMFGTEFRRLQQAHPYIAEQLEAALRERAGAGSKA